MKAIAVYPGKPNSMHLEEVPKPEVDDVPDGRDCWTGCCHETALEPWGGYGRQMTAARVTRGVPDNSPGPADSTAGEGRRRSAPSPRASQMLPSCRLWPARTNAF